MYYNFFQKQVRIVHIVASDINLPYKWYCATLNIFMYVYVTQQ